MKSTGEVGVRDCSLSTRQRDLPATANSGTPPPNSHDTADDLLFTGHVTLRRRVSAQPFCSIASEITRPSSPDRFVSPAVVCMIVEWRLRLIDLLAQLREESNAVKDLFRKGRTQTSSLN